MATRNGKSIITDKGREWLSRFLANYEEWSDAGYRLYHHTKWGEGGWEEINGLKYPKEPSFAAINNDLDVILNAGSFPATHQYFTDPVVMDLSSETVFEGGSTATLLIKAVLEQAEENLDPNDSDNPDFYEVGIFDNAFSMTDPIVRTATGVTEDNMILYATFDSVAKTNTRKFTVNIRIPWKV